MPDVLEVAGEAPRDDEHGVDAHVVTGTYEAWGECVRGGGDAAEAELVERESGLGGGGSGFDFDEGDGAAAPGDEVHLSNGCADPPCQHVPSFELKPECRDGLGPPAAPLRPLALHLSASARS